MRPSATQREQVYWWLEIVFDASAPVSIKSSKLFLIFRSVFTQESSLHVSELRQRSYVRCGSDSVFETIDAISIAMPNICGDAAHDK